MLTIDSWLEQKLTQLKLRDKHRDLTKVAPLQAFAMLAKKEFGSLPKSSEEWAELYTKFKTSGRIS